MFLSTVNCYPGSYSANNRSCKLCSPGFYQDEQGKEECQPCPVNTSSVVTGSITMADCKRKICHGHTTPQLDFDRNIRVFCETLEVCGILRKSWDTSWKYMIFENIVRGIWCFPVIYPSRDYNLLTARNRTTTQLQTMPDPKWRILIMPSSSSSQSSSSSSSFSHCSCYCSLWNTERKRRN